jgi:hypothetical protein
MATRPTPKSQGAIEHALRMRHAPAGNYLGDLTVVHGIFKALAKQFSDHAGAVAAKQIPHKEADQKDLDECNRLVWVFNGHDRGYSPVGEWNKAGGLAAALRQALPLRPNPAGNPDLDIFMALEAFHDQVYAELIAAMQDRQDPETTGHNITALIDRFSRLFAGLPVPPQ